MFYRNLFRSFFGSHAIIEVANAFLRAIATVYIAVFRSRRLHGYIAFQSCAMMSNNHQIEIFDKIENLHVTR